MVREHRSLILVLFFFMILLIIGTAGYVVLLQVSILDAFYMTVITITTVGFR